MQGDAGMGGRHNLLGAPSVPPTTTPEGSPPTQWAGFWARSSSNAADLLSAASIAYNGAGRVRSVL